MKKLLFLLSLILLCSSAYSQENQKSRKDFSFGDFDAVSQQKQYAIDMNATSGLLFQKASRQMLTAAGLGVVGGFLYGGSVVVKNKDAQYAMLAAGGLSSLIGLIYGVKGAITIGKAGKMLDRQQRGVAYLSPAKEGIGLNISF